MSKPVRKVATERIAIIGCVHIPYEDPKAVEATMNFLKFWKPDKLILNGDILDMYAISKHSKDPLRALNLQDEIDEGRDFLHDIRKLVGSGCDIVYNLGNHEARWARYLREEKTHLYRVDDFQYKNVMRLDQENIFFNEGRDGRYARVRLGEVMVGHFEVLRSHSAYTAKALVDTLGCSVVAHHSHRMGTYEKVTPYTRLLGQEGGCLCTLEPEYLESPNWSQGFVIMQKCEDKPRYQIEPIRIVGGDILYEGRLF